MTLATTGPAMAATYTWNGGSGNWKVAGNWSPTTGPPNHTDKAIIPSGTVTLDTLYSVSELTLGAGASLHITQWGLNLLSDNPANTCLVTNNGSIQVINPGPSTSSLGSALGSIVTLSGGGEVVLGGPYNNMGNGGHGGSFINDTDHTIRGGGYIQAGITNLGQIMADNGTLYLQAPFINTGGAIRVDGASSEIHLNGSITGGGLYPQDGKVILDNSFLANLTIGPGVLEVASGGFKGNITLDPGTQLTLDPGVWLYLDTAADGTPPTLTNNAVIQMNGQNVGISYNSAGILTGAGRIVMGGDFNNGISGTNHLTHGPNHTIEGGGTLYDIINNGTIKANNGILSLSSITNNGTVEVADYGGLSLLSGSFLTMADLFLPLHSSFSAGYLELKGKFSFAQQDVTQMTWQTASILQMSGGGTGQSLEVGGKDLKRNPSGFTNNFHLYQLKLQGGNTWVNLVDAIDNGNRTSGGREALYVQVLNVSPGTTLNLNGIRLYTYHGDAIFDVKPGEGPYYGGGNIIDVSIVPILPLLLLD